MLQKLYFFVSQKLLKYKRYKMAGPVLELLLKTGLKLLIKTFFDIKWKSLQNSVVPKTVASLFPFNCVAFLTQQTTNDTGYWTIVADI
jgi:hypothetical protein